MRGCKRIKILLGLCPFSHRRQGPPALTGGLLESETATWAFSWVCFCCPCWVSSVLGFLSLPLHWVFFALSFHRGSFRQVGLLLCLASASWGPSWDCFSQVKSEKQHHGCHGSVWFPRFCLTAAKIGSDWQTSAMVPCYNSVLFRNQREMQPWGMRAHLSKRREEKRREALDSILAPFLICFFSSPEPALCKLS